LFFTDLRPIRAYRRVNKAFGALAGRVPGRALPISGSRTKNGMPAAVPPRPTDANRRRSVKNP
jgi:hypothetical protein